MRDNDEGAVFALLEKFIHTLVVKATVSHRNNFVDKETIELDRHRKREGKTGTHPGRVVQDWLAKVDAKVRETLDKGHDFSVINAIGSADKSKVVKSRQILLKRSSKCERPRDRYAAADSSRSGKFGTADHPDQG